MEEIKTPDIQRPPEHKRPRKANRGAAAPLSQKELRRVPDEGSLSSRGAEARGGCNDVPASSAGSQLHQSVSQVVGPSDPVVAIVGDDTVLPCHLDPAVNAADMTVEWTRSDLTPRFVHVWRDGVELVNKKNEAYMERTSLPINNLKLGDISLKLSKVKLSDRGSYKCFSPALSGQASVELVVGVVSSLVITVMGNSEDSSKVVLQCESAGWYPEPELLWLDGEGNLLSAGPTETLRGPDDLYTVSSRVTVEKRHSNNITCRVQQRNTNQSRETHIHVPGKKHVI
ncbi:butyrophilin subfamily 2 member A2-like [Pelmatolapia mariae]|uniref:butyrophilin subfamily 2 member A2-like n=1 Tax=Pelmatolapia mariae TaxID=158779 RepID=UPI003211D48E